ncbi:uncharacterized protein LOC144763179 isoform X2 [Lissotriton helveticus]
MAIHVCVERTDEIETHLQHSGDSNVRAPGCVLVYDVTKVFRRCGREPEGEDQKTGERITGECGDNRWCQEMNPTQPRASAVSESGYYYSGKHNCGIQNQDLLYIFTGALMMSTFVRNASAVLTMY